MKLIDRMRTYTTEQMAFVLTVVVRDKVLPHKPEMPIFWKMDEKGKILYKALIAFLNMEVDETFEQYRYNLRRRTNE